MNGPKTLIYLYSYADEKQPAKHAEFVKQVIGQRDTLFDTVNILKQKCASSNDRSHVPARVCTAHGHVYIAFRKFILHFQF